MRKLSYIFIIISLIACTAGNKIIVSNLHDLASYPDNCQVFSLPKTQLAVQITAVRHHIVPGPYRSYAADLLGIQGVPELSQTHWEISTVDVREDIIPDPDYYFALNFTKGTTETPCLVNLFDRKLLLDPSDYASPLVSINGGTDSPEPIHYTDVSVARNTGTSKKVPVDLPILNHSYGEKTVSQKAEEAANFIIKIRKRRFKLLAGQYSVFPEGTALETSVRELNKLEEEYLSLFIGKTYSDTVTQTFYYTPETGRELERQVICRFTEETGFVPNDGNKGKPMVLNIQNKNQTGVLKSLQIPSEGSSFENKALYRIPERATLQVIYGSTVLLENELSIYQYGAFVPVSLVSEK